jgi:predicted component of type VI protein secretion system
VRIAGRQNFACFSVIAEPYVAFIPKRHNETLVASPRYRKANALGIVLRQGDIVSRGGYSFHGDILSASLASSTYYGRFDVPPKPSQPKKTDLGATSASIRESKRLPNSSGEPSTGDETSVANSSGIPISVSLKSAPSRTSICGSALRAVCPRNTRNTGK